MRLQWLMFYFAVAILGSLLSAIRVSGKRQEVCRTPQCNEIAQEILKNRNLSVNPCINFYEHACGSWSKNHPRPSHQLGWSELQRRQNKVYERVRSLLSEKILSNDIPAVKLMKQLYQSCLNTAAIDKRNVDPIIKFLDDTGGWPLIMPAGSWNPNRMSWQQIDGIHSRLIGRSMFYKFHFEADKNRQKNFLAIKRHLELPWIGNTITDDVWLFDENNPNAYGIFRVIFTFAKRKGVRLDKKQIKIDLDDMIYFEKNIRQIYRDVQGSERDFMTLGELQNWVSNSGVSEKKAKINFLDTVKYMFGLANINVGPSDSVVVYEKSFYRKLEQHLRIVPERAIVNYLQWNLVYALLTYSSTDMWKTKYHLIYGYNDRLTYPPRWLTCIKDLDLKDGVSYMFVNRYFPQSVGQRTLNMTLNIQKEIKNSALNSRGLSRSMKQFIAEKVDNVQRAIGYPNWYGNSGAITNQYDSLNIGPNYFENAINYIQYEFIRDLYQLNDIPSMARWAMQPTLVNAYYSGALNTIALPAAWVQDPYMTQYVPTGVNYGGVGTLIGHELAHSIDNGHINFDIYGRFFRWDYQSYQTYEQRKNCLGYEYSKFAFDVTDRYGNLIKLNGWQTMGENMADNIGIRATFSAYKKVSQYENVDMKLPGLENVSNDVLFFLSFANIWCSTTTWGYRDVNYAVHSPGYFRVIGALINLQEFSNTFQCRPQSPMNPANKCVILQ